VSRSARTYVSPRYTRKSGWKIPNPIVLPARRLAWNGLDAWAQVVGKGYEGYVAKEEASEYRGGPTRAWLKVKVPGWTDPEDRWKRLRLDIP
jgi:hypothetical protein